MLDSHGKGVRETVRGKAAARRFVLSNVPMLTNVSACMRIDNIAENYGITVLRSTGDVVNVGLGSIPIFHSSSSVLVLLCVPINDRDLLN